MKERNCKPSSPTGAGSSKLKAERHEVYIMSPPPPPDIQGHGVWPLQRYYSCVHAIKDTKKMFNVYARSSTYVVVIGGRGTSSNLR